MASFLQLTSDDTRPLPGRGLVGLAKVVVSCPALASKRRVEYFRLATQSLLNRCANPQMPFQWTINPYRGCEFGCKYCYARYTHEFMGLEDPREFEEKIYSKERAGEILNRELRHDPVGAIAIGTATDPYQPAERHSRTTRAILETLAGFQGLRLSLTTKSDLVLRDLALLQELGRGNALQVNITITTLRAELARKLEPLAPRPDLRLAAVHSLAAAGIAVGIFAMPILPAITDAPGDLEAIARAGAAAGASSFATQLLFLMPSAKAAFFPFLEQEFPHLVAHYVRLYRHGAYLGGEIADRNERLTARLRKQYFPAHRRRAKPVEPFGRRDQLALFRPPARHPQAPARSVCGR